MYHIEIEPSFIKYVRRMADDYFIKRLPIFIISLKSGVPSEFVKLYLREYAYRVYNLVNENLKDKTDLDLLFDVVGFLNGLSSELVEECYYYHLENMEREERRNRKIIVRLVRFFQKLKSSRQ